MRFPAYNKQNPAAGEANNGHILALYFCVGCDDERRGMGLTAPKGAVNTSAVAVRSANRGSPFRPGKTIGTEDSPSAKRINGP